MRIAIIGGGLTGLTAGWKLSLKGHQITIFEKEKYLGGLCATFKQKDWIWPLEFFYHHLFTSDKDAQKLIKDLNLSEKLFYQEPKSSVLENGQIFQFDSPLSLMKFPCLPFLDKLRAGVVTVFLKFALNFSAFERIRAADWLSKAYGQKVYQTIWQPLLKAKFGQDSKNISLSWFWARIKKRNQTLGYLQGSLQIIINKLAKEIKKQKGVIILDKEIKSLDQLKGFDRFLFTIPVYSFLKIVGNQLPTSERGKLAKLKMSGAANLVLILKKSFLNDGTYWLSVNENNFPFVAVVQHTNFINKRYYGQHYILYVGGYYPQNHAYFKTSKEKVLAEFLPYLQKIKSGFKKTDILNYQLFANKDAQPTRTINYLKNLPEIKTPIENIFLANMQQVYPYDRGINYAIQLGLKVADVIIKS